MAERVYWDSCIWIALINEEAGRVDSARWLIERAEKGEVEIWTSTLSLAEVFKAKCGTTNKALAAAADSQLDAFLSQPYIVHVQLDQDIGREARKVLRMGLPALKKPNDAVHLASALWHSVDTFHTYDRDDLLPLNGMLTCQDGKALNITKPPQRPAPPQKLQADMFSAPPSPQPAGLPQAQTAQSQPSPPQATNGANEIKPELQPRVASKEEEKPDEAKPAG